MPTLQHLGKGTSQICPAQPQQGTPRRGQGLLERPLVTRLEYLKLRTCKNDLHQFANASSPIFTHSRLFQNSCLILKRRVPRRIGCGRRGPVGKPCRCLCRSNGTGSDDFTGKFQQTIHGQTIPVIILEPWITVHTPMPPHTHKRTHKHTVASCRGTWPTQPNRYLNGYTGEKKKKFSMSCLKFSTTRYPNPTEITPGKRRAGLYRTLAP